MDQKYINLNDLVKFTDDINLSERYINYLCGFNAEEHKYRKDEILCIKRLIDFLCLEEDYCYGFLYSYEIPHLNKEFDLLKISKKECLNIELKTKINSEEKVKKQLLQNRHYLAMLNKIIICITYIEESNKFYLLNDSNELELIDKEFVKRIMLTLDYVKPDLGNLEEREYTPPITM